jgi:hypothetical protein
VFKFAADDGLIARPVRYGQGFARPSAKTLRLHRAGQGKKLFTAEEVRRLIDGAGQPLKAMLRPASPAAAPCGRKRSRPSARRWPGGRSRRTPPMPGWCS